MKLKDVPEKAYFRISRGDYSYVCLKPTLIVCKVTSYPAGEKKGYIPIVNISLGTMLCLPPDTEVTLMASTPQLKVKVLILEGRREGQEGTIEVKYPAGMMTADKEVYKIRFSRTDVGMYTSLQFKLAEAVFEKDDSLVYWQPAAVGSK